MNEQGSINSYSKLGNISLPTLKIFLIKKKERKKVKGIIVK